MNANKLFNVFIYFFLIWILFGYNPEPTFSATEHTDLENELENYLIEQEENVAGLATIVINEDEIIYKMKGYADIGQHASMKKLFLNGHPFLKFLSGSALYN